MLCPLPSFCVCWWCFSSLFSFLPFFYSFSIPYCKGVLLRTCNLFCFLEFFHRCSVFISPVVCVCRTTRPTPHPDRKDLKKNLGHTTTSELASLLVLSTQRPATLRGEVGLGREKGSIVPVIPRPPCSLFYFSLLAFIGMGMALWFIATRGSTKRREQGEARDTQRMEREVLRMTRGTLLYISCLWSQQHGGRRQT